MKGALLKRRLVTWGGVQKSGRAFAALLPEARLDRDVKLVVPRSR